MPGLLHFQADQPNKKAAHLGRPFYIDLPGLPEVIQGSLVIRIEWTVHV